jgi:hypothetical protein
MNRLPISLSSILAPALWVLILALVPGISSAASLLYEIQSGATIQIDSGPIEALMGSFRIRCQGPASPNGACTGVGDATYDIPSLALDAASLSLSGAGPFPPISNGSGSLSVGRLLSLSDVGLLLPGNPPKDAALYYGFDGELVSSGATLDRYRVWTLGFPPTTTTWTPDGGILTPGQIDFDGLLVETFFDLDVSGLITQSTGSTANVSFTAMFVPQPGSGALLGSGLLVLASARRAARTRGAH